MKKIISIILGNGLIAFAISTLVLDNNIVAGGVSGIGIIMEHHFGLSVSAVVAAINIVLFVLGLIFIGKAFAAKTLVSTFIFPIFLKSFNDMEFLHGYLTEPLLAALLAGCIIGFGIGIIINAGASTGGIDIIGVILNNKLNIPLRHSLNAIDFAILIFQLGFHDITHEIYGLVIIIITYTVMNKTLTMNGSPAKIYC